MKKPADGGHQMNEQIKAVTLSYTRVFAAAILALYLAGERDLAMLWEAGVAAILPPLLRWLNPNDTNYGRTKK
jgi:hypothetical protein